MKRSKPMGEEERHALLAESLMRTKTRKAESNQLDDFIHRLSTTAPAIPALNQKLKELNQSQRTQAVLRRQLSHAEQAGTRERIALGGARNHGRRKDSRLAVETKRREQQVLDVDYSPGPDFLGARGSRGAAKFSRFDVSPLAETGLLPGSVADCRQHALAAPRKCSSLH